MSDKVQETTTIQHSLPSEGADELLLAGVNDVNLKALAKLSVGGPDRDTARRLLV